MSDQVANAAISRMNLREIAIEPSGHTMSSDLTMLSRADAAVENVKAEERKGELCDTYGFKTPEQRKPFAFANGIAFIPVSGTLINRFGQCWGYITGYNYIRSCLNAALADDDVKGIVFDLNSYGGEAAGCFELADEIFASRSIKPSLGVIDSNCYSACFAIGSACSRLVSIPSGGAGSVGVMSMHIDASKLYQNMGLTFTLIYSGDHKADGNPYEALPASVKANIKKGVTKTREKFANLIARNRGIELDAVLATEAQTYRADDAIEIGFIDAVATPQEAVTTFFNEINGLETEGDEDMSTTTPAPTAAAQPGTTQNAPQAGDASAAAATARTDERTRISSILNCEAAKGRTALASHIALNTNMSLEDATGMLNASPLAAAAAPAPAAPAPVVPAAAAPAAPVVQVDGFTQHMNGSQHPTIPASAAAPGGGDDRGEDAVARILSAQSAASGVKFDMQ